ncbi:unnamed protein product, partial [Ectocarpus sp. 12 AP-2014]
ESRQSVRQELLDAGKGCLRRRAQRPQDGGHGRWPPQGFVEGSHVRPLHARQQQQDHPRQHCTCRQGKRDELQVPAPADLPERAHASTSFVRRGD